MDIGLVLEEVRLEDHNNKDEPVQAIRMRLKKRSGERDLCGERQIETISYRVGKDFSQIPTIWLRRWQHVVNGERHDSTIVKEHNDKGHEGRELKLVVEHQYGNADNDTDRNSTDINRVVSHVLEYDMGTTDSMENGRETSSFEMMTTAPRAASVASSTAIPTLARGRTGTSFAPSPVIGQNVITKTKATVDLLSNGGLISSDHLNLDTEGASSIFAWCLRKVDRRW